MTLTASSPPASSLPEKSRIDSRSAFVDAIIDLYARRGDAHYGEDVSQREHAEQCAHHAQKEGAAMPQVIAALLHDIGHLLHKQGEDAADRGVDTRHERIGSGFLARGLPPSVTAPIALHVAAKRYLATMDPGYLEKLSPASLQSFELQGGVMTAEEIAAFEANPWREAAMRLRAWDEMGKTVGAQIAPFSSYMNALRELMLQDVFADFQA